MTARFESMEPVMYDLIPPKSSMTVPSPLVELRFGGLEQQRELAIFVRRLEERMFE
jgi:hypothetical protein